MLSDKLFGKIIIPFLAMLLSSSYLFAAEAPPEVIKAAKDGLTRFIIDDAPGLEKYGLTTNEEKKNAELGEGFKVCNIIIEKLSVEILPNHLDDAISCNDSYWEFLVKSKGKFKSIIRVVFSNNTWEAVAIGTSPLVKKLELIITKWPSHAGYGHLMVRGYDKRNGFMLLSHNNKVAGVIPLDSKLAKVFNVHTDDLVFVKENEAISELNKIIINMVTEKDKWK